MLQISMKSIPNNMLSYFEQFLNFPKYFTLSSEDACCPMHQETYMIFTYLLCLLAVLAILLQPLFL